MVWYKVWSLYFNLITKLKISSSVSQNNMFDLRKSNKKKIINILLLNKSSILFWMKATYLIYLFSHLPGQFSVFHLPIAFLSFLDHLYFYDCLPICRDYFQFHDILILKKDGRSKSFILNCSFIFSKSSFI